MIEISFGKMIIPENERFIGFAGDNLHSTKIFLLKNVSETDCIYRLYLTFDDGNTNYFALDSKVENGSTYLQWTISEDHIIKSGIVKAQIKAFYNDDRIYHTTYDYFIVAPSTECDSDFSEKENSEFLDYEKRLNDILTEITSLEKGFVPVEREIAGVNLADDISCEELNKALNTYPIKKLTVDPTLFTSTKGEISQLGYLVSYDGKTYSVKMYILRAIQGEHYIWQEISGNSTGSANVDLSNYVKTSRTIAGVDLAEDISAETLNEALSVYPVVELPRKPRTAPEQELELKGKVGQIGIEVSTNTTVISFYRCVSVTPHPQYGNTFIYEWEYLGTNSNLEYYPYSAGNNHSFGKHRGNMAYYDGSKSIYIWTGYHYYKMLIETDVTKAIDENSTDEQIPSAKAVIAYVDNTVGDINTSLELLHVYAQEIISGGATQ